MNTTTAKARKSAALIEELERLDTSERLDDLEIRRLARDAEALMPSDPAGAHTVLGGVAGIRGDAAKVHEHYRAALHHSQRELAVLNNYAIALGRAGKFEEALPAIMEARKRAPDDTFVLKNAANVAVQGGRFAESLPLYDAWNRLCPDEPLTHEGAARKAAEAARRGAFTEAGVGNVLRLAHEVRVRAKVRSAGFSMDAVFGERDSFSFALHVRSTPVGAANLGDEFVERVVADDALMNNPGLTFTVGFRGTTINGRNG